MNILLGLAIGIVSAGCSFGLKMNAKYDCLTDIAGKGYKYDKELLDKYFEGEKIKQFKISTANEVKGILDSVITCIPIVNLLYACIYRANMKRKMMKSSEFNKALIPMTGEEMREFAELDSRIGMLIYAGAVSTTLKHDKVFNDIDEESITNISKDDEVNTQDEEEILNYNSNDIQDEECVIMTDDTMTNDFDVKKIHIRHDELLPLGYTLDEVKKLNEALTVKMGGKVVEFEYKAGRLNGEYVAIIGVPNLNKNANEAERLEVMGSIMEELSDDEAKKYTFSVYPQVIFGAQEFENLQNTIEEITKERYSHYDTIDDCEFDDEPKEDADSYDGSSKHGHVLKKTKK